MSADIYAYIHKMNTELEEAMVQLNNSNYGLTQKKLAEMYHNNLALQSFINGGLDEMAAEYERTGEKVVIDCMDIPDED